MMAEVKKAKGRIHDLVDKGITTVEEIHKSIVQASRESLEQIAPEDVKPHVEPAKDIYDKATHAVYDTIRMVNRKVCEISDEVLDKVEDVSTKVGEAYRETVDPWSEGET